MMTFAADFDPQPFHLDEIVAAKSIFRGLAASGWHTAAVTMRLLVHSDLRPAGGIIGFGLEEMQWPRPVRPGDELHVETEILQARPTASKPGQGLLKVRNTTFNPRGEAVLSQTVNPLVLRVGAASQRRTGGRTLMDQPPRSVLEQLASALA